MRQWGSGLRAVDQHLGDNDLVFLHSSAPLVAQNMQPEKCFFVNGKMKL
jgi:hypothetical protein